MKILAFMAAVVIGLAGAAQAQMATPQTFDSAGVKISYREAGKGDEVILVHGLYSSAEVNWVLPGTFAALAKDHHVVAFDLRGHGNSDKPEDEASYGTPMVEDITRLMDHLKIEKAQIVGYSLGGIVAMRFIVDHPNRVVSGTLGGMGWLKEGSFEERVFGVMGDRLGSKTPPACVHGIAKLSLTEAELKGIKAPLEILEGDRDPTNQLYVLQLKKVRPEVPVVTIDGAGHLNCIVKDQFKTELVKWVDKNGK